MVSSTSASGGSSVAIGETIQPEDDPVPAISGFREVAQGLFQQERDRAQIIVGAHGPEIDAGLLCSAAAPFVPTRGQAERYPSQ